MLRATQSQARHLRGVCPTFRLWSCLFQKLIKVWMCKYTQGCVSVFTAQGSSVLYSKAGWKEEDRIKSGSDRKKRVCQHTAELHWATPDPSCLEEAGIFRQVPVYLSPVDVCFLTRWNFLRNLSKWSSTTGTPNLSSFMEHLTIQSLSLTAKNFICVRTKEVSIFCR